MVFEPRTYRDKMTARGLISFQVTSKETDLWIAAKKNLKDLASSTLIKIREELEAYIKSNINFKESYIPVEVPETAPLVVRMMAKGAKKAGVGPMAAVAGAIAEIIGKKILEESEEVIVENGGDIFLKSKFIRKIAVYAGKSKWNEKVALIIKPEQTPLGICTSSGTVGHSLSFGKSDAVIVFSKETAFADAEATALGNRIKNEEDVEKVIEMGKKIKEVEGLLIIVGEKLGAWGNVEIEPIS